MKWTPSLQWSQSSRRCCFAWVTTQWCLEYLFWAWPTTSNIHSGWKFNGIANIPQIFHCCLKRCTANFYPMKTTGTGNLRDPCRENLHCLWKRAVRKPCDNYRSCNHHGVSLQFLQPFSIDSADFPCRSPAISSPCSFYGQNICSLGVFNLAPSSKNTKPNH